MPRRNPPSRLPQESSSDAVARMREEIYSTLETMRADLASLIAQQRALASQLCEGAEQLQLTEPLEANELLAASSGLSANAALLELAMHQQADVADAHVTKWVNVSGGPRTN